MLPLADVRFFGRFGEEIEFSEIPARRFAVVAVLNDVERHRARDAGMPETIVAGFEGTSENRLAAVLDDRVDSYSPQILYPPPTRLTGRDLSAFIESCSGRADIERRFGDFAQIEPASELLSPEAVRRAGMVSLLICGRER